MIKYTEVRIGNLVNKNGEPAPISAGDFLKVDLGAKELKGVEPIPLTPEWLGRFGFVTMDNEYDFIDWGREDTYLKFSFIQSGLPVDQQPFIFEYDQGMGDQKIELKFVHQLQNLYFDLTGKELTIKK